jgi:hypothetical protein
MIDEAVRGSGPLFVYSSISQAGERKAVGWLCCAEINSAPQTAEYGQLHKRHTAGTSVKEVKGIRALRYIQMPVHGEAAGKAKP